MTSMEHAMKTAGIPIKPLYQRVWLYIRDHPNSSLNQLSKIFEGSVAQALHTLTERKMLKVTKDRRLCGRFYKDINLYSVAMREWELLPAPIKAKAKAAPKPVPAEQPSKPEPVKDASRSFDEFIDGLTIAEARKLHTQLSKMFKS